MEQGLREIHRLLRPGGCAYLLLYGSGGLFWPLNALLRPLAELVGQEDMVSAIEEMGLGPNKRRVLLDDAFVPILETYSTERVAQLLKDAGFAAWRKWKPEKLTYVWTFGGAGHPRETKENKCSHMLQCVGTCLVLACHKALIFNAMGLAKIMRSKNA